MVMPVPVVNIYQVSPCLMITGSWAWKFPDSIQSMSYNSPVVIGFGDGGV
jgi:hypothetical protein